MTTATLAEILVRTGVVVSYETDDQNIVMLGRISEAAALVTAAEAEKFNREIVAMRGDLADSNAQRDEWRACAERAIGELTAHSKYPQELLAEFDRLTTKASAAPTAALGEPPPQKRATAAETSCHAPEATQ